MKYVSSFLILMLFGLFLQGQQHFTFKKSGKFGIINSKGTVTCAPSFDYISRANDSRFFAYKEAKWRYIDEKGKEFVFLSFNSFLNVNETISLVKHKNYWGILNTKKDSLITSISFSESLLQDNIISLERGGSTFFYSLYGYFLFSTDKKVELKPTNSKYSMYLLFQDKKALVRPKTQRIEWFDNWYSFENYDIGVLNNQEFILNKKGILLSKVSVINQKKSRRNWVVSTNKETFIFDDKDSYLKLYGIKWADFVSNNLVLTKDTFDRLGVYNYATKSTLLPNKYKELNEKESIFLGRIDAENFDIIDNNYRIINSVNAQNLEVFNEDILYVHKNGRMGVYSISRNKLIIPIKYQWLEYSPNKAIVVFNNGKYGLLWKNGKELIPCKANKIIAEKDKYKVYLDGNKMEIYYHNGNGIITDKILLENVISAGVEVVRKTEYQELEYAENDSYFFTSKHNTNELKESAKFLGWFTKDIDTTSEAHLRWGFKDSVQKNRLNPGSTIDVFQIDSTFSLVYSVKHKVVRKDPLQTASFYSTKIFNHNKYKFRPLKLHTVQKSDVFSSSPVLLGFYEEEFYFIDKQRYIIVDTFSFVSPVFNDSLRFATKKGKMKHCLEEDPEQYMPISQFGRFLEDLDSISPLYFENYLFQRKIKESRGNVPQGNYLKIENSKWGVYDTKWNLLVPIQYDFIYPYQANVFIVKNNGKKGLLTLDSVVFPIVHNEIERLRSEKDSVFIFSNSTRANKLMDKNGKLLESESGVLSYEPILGELVKIRKRRGWGVYDFAANKMVMEPVYSRINYLPEGVLLLKHRKKLGIADLQGNILVSLDTYKSLSCISEGIYLAENQKNKFGLLNNRGDTVLSFIYKEIVAKDSFVVAAINGALEVYDKSFKLLFTKKMQFQIANNKFIAVNKNGKTRIIDVSNGKFISGKHQEVIGLGNKEVFIKRNRILLKVDLRTNEVTDTLHDWTEITQFTENTYLAKSAEDKKFYVIDTSYSIISSYRQREIITLSSRYFYFSGRKGGQIFDKVKDSVIPMEVPFFQFISYSQGLFLCKNYQGGYLFFDSLGNLKHNQIFTRADGYQNDIAVIMENKQFLTQDLTGTVTNIFPQYSSIKRITPTKFVATSGRLYGLVDNKGVVLINNEYQKLSLIGTDWIQVYKDNTISYYNLKTRTWLIK